MNYQILNKFLNMFGNWLLSFHLLVWNFAYLYCHIECSKNAQNFAFFPLMCISGSKMETDSHFSKFENLSSRRQIYKNKTFSRRTRTCVRKFNHETKHWSLFHAIFCFQKWRQCGVCCSCSFTFAICLSVFRNSSVRIGVGLNQKLTNYIQNDNVYGSHLFFGGNFLRLDDAIEFDAEFIENWNWHYDFKFNWGFFFQFL